MIRELTYNFKMQDELPEDEEGVFSKEFLDSRNGIRVTRIKPNLDMYINYLDLLMKHRDEWISNGYLDLGMIPLAMAPDFVHPVFKEQLLVLAQKAGLSAHIMPAVSFFKDNYNSSETDVWVTREDAAKLLGVGILDVTTQALINKLKEYSA